MMAKKTQTQNNEDKSYSRITSLKMEALLPQVMNNVIIGMIDGYHVQQLPDNMSGDKYKTFKKTRGGVFTRDSLAFSRNQPHGEYFLFDGDGQRFIGRIIKEDEALLFHTFHLVDGKLVDVEYMKLRDLEADEKLTNSIRYIKETNNELEDEELAEVVSGQKPEAEDDTDAVISSISLFDE